MKNVADLLTGLRIALAPVFVWTLLASAPGSLLPLAVFALAAASDFVDGRLARAGGWDSSAGRLFDHAADALFLFPALMVLAGAGRVPVPLPFATTSAFALYVLDGWRRGAGVCVIDLAPSRVGAAAGVLNYVVAAFAAGAVWIGPSMLDRVLYAGASGVAVVNLVAALDRLHRLLRPAEPGWAAERSAPD